MSSSAALSADWKKQPIRQSRECLSCQIWHLTFLSPTHNFLPTTTASAELLFSSSIELQLTASGEYFPHPFAAAAYWLTDERDWNKSMDSIQSRKQWYLHQRKKTLPDDFILLVKVLQLEWSEMFAISQSISAEKKVIKNHNFNLIHIKFLIL